MNAHVSHLPSAGRPARRPPARPRRGAVAVLVALLLIVLLGFLGLVIDSGLMMAGQRQAQNAADAAALAAAEKIMRGRSHADAVADADAFVRTHNGLADAAPLTLGSNLHIPPVGGPHAGDPRYVEVVVTVPYNTLFMHVLGGARGRQVGGRAVAGYEALTSGDGCIVLDPQARPGLDISGGGRLMVKGRVLVNSEGGGVDENGNLVNGNTGYAASAAGGSGTGGVWAEDLRIVGGVDDPAAFHHIDPAETARPLHARQVPAPDPFAHLPTPTTANGVLNTNRGTVSITGGTGSTYGVGNTETVNSDGTTTYTLNPGLYDSISITGGIVRLEPGIYVLLDKAQTPLKITGGDVVGTGVMFYMTGSQAGESSYSAVSGTPDVNDPPDPYNSDSPPKTNRSVTINGAAMLTPIDSRKYSYPGTPDIAVFDGMLFYQRRWYPAAVDIQGNSTAGSLSGSIYAKWANFKISGQGTYGAQFVVGSMTVPGQGDVTITYAGDDLGRAPNVFLVE